MTFPEVGLHGCYLLTLVDGGVPLLLTLGVVYYLVISFLTLFLGVFDTLFLSLSSGFFYLFF